MQPSSVAASWKMWDQNCLIGRESVHEKVCLCLQGLHGVEIFENNCTMCTWSCLGSLFHILIFYVMTLPSKFISCWLLPWYWGPGSSLVFDKTSLHVCILHPPPTLKNILKEFYLVSRYGTWPSASAGVSGAPELVNNAVVFSRTG